MEWCSVPELYNVEMSPLAMGPHGPQMQTEQELLLALQQNIDGAVAIASTVRAARALRQLYNQEQQASGNHGWRSPQILAWEPWLGTLWNAAILCGAESRVPLTGAQEAELWRQVLERDEAAARTLSITGLAEQAQQAWEAMQRYRIPLQDVRSDSSMDAQAFARWAMELEKLCRRSSFLSSSLIEAALATVVGSGKIQLPERIFLVGFDRTTPSQRLLIDALRSYGCDVEMVELEQATGAAFRAHAIVYTHTLEEEIEAAARWIRTTLLENPSQRIGVIAPALGEMRDRIDATFRRVLAPSSMDVHTSSARLPYEFSLGASMHRMQPIRTALTLLQWLDQAMPAEEISWLLVHGGFGAGSVDARAMLDKKFRDRDYQLGGSVSLFTFRQWLSQAGNNEDVAPLRRTIERVSAAANRQVLDRSRSFADWRESIEELLAAADWHLLTATDSTDYQLLRRWNVLLNELSSLNAVTGLVTFSAAMERLKTLAANMLFTLETKNAPVQILGASESAGLLFDQIWWMNAQASNWPPHGHAQPFLPWPVQRAVHMPYADPEEDYSFALRATKRILGSAKNAVVSFALQESDPTTASAHVPSPEIAVSPLVRELLPNTSMIAVEDFLPDRNRVERKRDSGALEAVDEEPAVSFQADRVRGGVTFLKQQAACPFRAFAEFRLGSEPLAEPANGLSATAQGTIVHEVLQNFWSETQFRQKLLESTDEQLRQVLRGHIRNALRRFFEHTDEPWQRSLLEIEADRVEERLLTWLEMEKQRADFTVLKTEDTLEAAHLGGIELRCRIDRIDAVANGIVLMDYKTGAVNANACDGDRPDEPQLPAYAVLRQRSASKNNPLVGIAFAGLHARNVGFTVVGSLPGIFPVSSGTAKNKRGSLSAEEMEQQQAEWSGTLTRLAEDFRLGTAVVDPKNGSETCKYCAQALLCRIGETGDAAEDADDEGQENFSAADDWQRLEP